MFLDPQTLASLIGKVGSLPAGVGQAPGTPPLTMPPAPDLGANFPDAKSMGPFQAAEDVIPGRLGSFGRRFGEELGKSGEGSFSDTVGKSLSGQGRAPTPSAPPPPPSDDGAARAQMVSQGIQSLGGGPFARTQVPGAGGRMMPSLPDRRRKSIFGG